MKKLSRIISVSVLAITFLAGIAHAQTWSNPTTTPPAGNIYPPVNTGGVMQEKSGWLGSGNFYGNRRLGATEIRTESLCLENPLGHPSGYLKSWTQGLLLPQTNCITDWSQVGGSGTGGTNLPTGQLNDTMRFDGTNWVADSFLKNDASRVRVGQMMMGGNYLLAQFGVKGGSIFDGQVRVGSPVQTSTFNPNINFEVAGTSVLSPVQMFNGATAITGQLYFDDTTSNTQPPLGTRMVLTNTNNGFATWQPGLPMGSTTGQVLVWNGTLNNGLGGWVPGAMTVGNGAADGDTIYWDGFNSVWIADQNIRNNGVDIELNGPASVSGGQLSARTQINAEGNAMANDWGQVNGSFVKKHPFAIQGTHQKLLIGVDTNLGTSYLQGVDNNTAPSAISLNRQGGNIFIGDIFNQSNNWFASFTQNNSFAGSTGIGMAPDSQYKLAVDGGTASPLNGLLVRSHGSAYTYGILTNVDNPYTKALAVQDTTTGLENFRVYGNGETFAGGKLTVDTGTNTGDLAEFRGDGNVIIKPGEDTGQVIVGPNTTLGIPLVVNGNVHAVTPNSPQTTTGFLYVAGPSYSCGVTPWFSTVTNNVFFAQFSSPSGRLAIASGIASPGWFSGTCDMGPNAQYTSDVLDNSGNSIDASKILNIQTTDNTNSNGCSVASGSPTQQALVNDDCQNGSYEAAANGPSRVYELYITIVPDTIPPDNDVFYWWDPDPRASVQWRISPMVRVYNKVPAQVNGGQGNFIGRGAQLSSLSDDPNGDGIPAPDGVLQKICTDDNGWIVPCGGAGVEVAPGDINGQTLRWQEAITNSDGTVTPAYWKHNDNNLLNDGITVMAQRPFNDSPLPCTGNFGGSTCPARPLVFSALATDPIVDLGLRVDEAGKTQVSGKFEVVGDSILRGGDTTIGTSSDPYDLKVWGDVDVQGVIVNGEPDSGIPGQSGYPEGDAGQVIVDDPTYISNSLGISGGLKTFFGDVYSGNNLIAKMLEHTSLTPRPVCVTNDGVLVKCDVSGARTFFSTGGGTEYFQPFTIPNGISNIHITLVGGGAGGGGGRDEKNGDDDGAGGAGGGGSGGYLSDQIYPIGNPDGDPNTLDVGDTIYVLVGRGGQGGNGGHADGFSSISCGFNIDFSATLGNFDSVIPLPSSGYSQPGYSCSTSWVQGNTPTGGQNGIGSYIIKPNGNSLTFVSGGGGGYAGLPNGGGLGGSSGPNGIHGGNGHSSSTGPGHGGGGGAGGAVGTEFLDIMNGDLQSPGPGYPYMYNSGGVGLNSSVSPYIGNSPFDIISGFSVGGSGGDGGCDGNSGPQGDCQATNHTGHENGGDGSNGTGYGGGGGGGGGAGDPPGFLGIENVRSGGKGGNGSDGVVYIRWE